MQNPKVIDADGHIYENHEEIEEYFEGKYRGMRRAKAYPLFPSLDGWPRSLGGGRSFPNMKKQRLPGLCSIASLQRTGDWSAGMME